jgi:hypothetical protein
MIFALVGGSLTGLGAATSGSVVISNCDAGAASAWLLSSANALFEDASNGGKDKASIAAGLVEYWMLSKGSFSEGYRGGGALRRSR